MYIIEVSEDKMVNLEDTIGKILHYGGKAMECIEDMKSHRVHEDASGHSRGHSYYDDDDDDDDDDDYVREREHECRRTKYPEERYRKHRYGR